jgi:predicted  nucleic acid-binding Zn-ribbon protein
MFKNIIAPVQAWLLSNKQCVGCGARLDTAKKEERKDNTEKVTCKCGRIYIYEKASKKFRRALFEEV